VNWIDCNIFGEKLYPIIKAIFIQLNLVELSSFKKSWYMWMDKLLCLKSCFYLLNQDTPNLYSLWDLRFSWWWKCQCWSSGLKHHLDLSTFQRYMLPSSSAANGSSMFICHYNPTQKTNIELILLPRNLSCNFHSSFACNVLYSLFYVTLNS
jgi:hypothetical protein